eukprot:gene12546-biopygen4190
MCKLKQCPLYREGSLVTVNDDRPGCGGGCQAPAGCCASSANFGSGISYTHPSNMATADYELRVGCSQYLPPLHV